MRAPGEASLPLVIVVAYGVPDLLGRALTPISGALDVVVVDNSLSESVAGVARRHSARYVRPGCNVGFAAGVNLGLVGVSTYRDVLLLNPDATITAEDVLRLQVALHAKPRCAAVAPLLRRPTGETERTCWPMPTPFSPWAGVVGLADRGANTIFLSGAVLMLNGTALAEVGGLDERFFLYAEEADWQLRAQRAGWLVSECAGVTATHVGGATSADPLLRDALFYGSADLFAQKWFTALGQFAFRTGSVLAALRRALLAKSSTERARHVHATKLLLRGPARLLPTVTGRLR